MRIQSNLVRLSATDLSSHLECRHLTALDLAVELGRLEKPEWTAPHLWVLQERGREHEAAYIRHLRGQGLDVTDLNGVKDEAAAIQQTEAAMRRGAGVIVQASLEQGRWLGRADVLRRVERASNLGAWSYEVYDCKLARETKAATILQLSLYSELLQAIQGVLPERMYVVPPSPGFAAEAHRVLDYAAYFRFVKRQLEDAVQIHGHDPRTYPEPVPHCEMCKWWRRCDKQRRADDHLSLVAGISRLQRRQLQDWDTTTMRALAQLPLPLQRTPDRGSKKSYERVREQARVQISERDWGKPVHEMLPVETGLGLCRLPAPDAGDVFLDLEGDAFAGPEATDGPGGLEYLFGIVALDGAASPVYLCRWALTPAEERASFEWFVDEMTARLERHPGMHIYHFGVYEPGALKRLMGRYATRENELDRLLRRRVFVDLHSILKQSVRASVEEYSLKAVEKFHGYLRRVPLAESRTALRRVEHALELQRAASLQEDLKRVVEGYNADDCFSAQALRDWLEARRDELVRAGQPVARPAPPDSEPSEDSKEQQERVAQLFAELMRDVPANPETRTEEQRAHALLANLLDFHRREAKAVWWEYFHRNAMSDEELLQEKSAIAGLTLVKRLPRAKNSFVDRYLFPPQDTDIREHDNVYERGDGGASHQHVGEVLAIDLAERTLDIKKTGRFAERHPTAVFAFDKPIRPGELAMALLRFGQFVVQQGVDAPGQFRAGRDLLLHRPPRLSGGKPLLASGEDDAEAARRVVTELDHTTLAIQGPPGSGKTYTGARMICALLEQGKRVGVTAVSHKVIRNLLLEVLRAARESGMPALQGVRVLHKVTHPGELETIGGLAETEDNNEARRAVGSTVPVVVGGTAWLWAREEMAGQLDVLFVDEAGQMSLAYALAASQAAKSMVLLGDPQQLDQPKKGSHPDGADASALEHLLGGEKTMPAGRGLFLRDTWRLHPKVTEFTSEVFYEGRLHSRAGLARQHIEGHDALREPGVWLAPVEHEGNQNSSLEEVEKVASLVDGLLRPGVKWVDRKGQRHDLRMEDILIVAPYNSQVSDLSRRLRKARVGTVDKFQGQEAPVVIYSLTTSTPEDAPRGMEFLYSLNRLNVATSRARAAVVVVGSSRLLEPECRSPRQMRLANALCRYAEFAEKRRL